MDTLRATNKFETPKGFRRYAAGLLTCGSLDSDAFPVAQWLCARTLAAHSCGGSHGFGPDWVIRTVFPLGLLGRLASKHRVAHHMPGCPRAVNGLTV